MSAYPTRSVESHPVGAASSARPAAVSKYPAGGWLLREPDPEAESLLFCVPYLGTGASMFHGWPRTIGRTEVCPIQPPGRENRLREESHASYEDFASDLIDSLLPYLDRPFELFAHCNSVYVAVEVVRQLQRRGLPQPTRLIASSMVPPGLMPYGSILDVPEDGLDAVVADLMRGRGFEPDPELVELALDSMVADVRAYRRYQPDHGRMPCPITVLGWTQDHEVPPTLLTGWDGYADTETRLLVGSHWSFLAFPDELREALTTWGVVGSGVAGPGTHTRRVAGAPS